MTTYQNPILPGFNPDPSICRVGDTFYLVTSTFEFYPGIPIYTSKNLVQWTLTGHAINRPNQGIDMRTLESQAGLWAPTIRYRPASKDLPKGRWYIACGTCYGMGVADIRGFYVWTEDITDETKWSDAVFFDHCGIDQDLFFDDDGKTYLSVTHEITDPTVKPVPTDIPGDTFSQAAYVIEIDIETGRSLSESKILRVSPTGMNEGSHIIKKDGWYYLFTADGGTFGHHQEWVSRSKSPVGPYEPAEHNPILHNGDHPLVRNTGHMDLVDDQDGNWWIVTLGVRIRPDTASDPLRLTDMAATQLGRETFLAPMEWKDGWPIVNGGKRLELEMTAKLPAPVSGVQRATSWSDEFATKDLQSGWYFLRTPVKSFHHITPGQGISIYGNAFRIEHRESPAMLLRKQPAFNLDWTTEMTFEPTLPKEEAGTTVWVHGETFASIGIRLDEQGQREAIVQYAIMPHPRYIWLKEKIPLTTRTVPLKSKGPVRLVIRARTESYELSMIDVASDKVVLTEKFSTEHFYTLFTGAHLGLYAMGADSAPCLKPAVFKYAKFEEL